jgi:hypothetical protein
MLVMRFPHKGSITKNLYIHVKIGIYCFNGTMIFFKDKTFDVIPHSAYEILTSLPRLRTHKSTPNSDH